MSIDDILRRSNKNEPKLVRVVVVDSDNKRIPQTRLGQMWKRTKEITNEAIDWSIEKTAHGVGHVLNFMGRALEHPVVAGIAVFLGIAAIVAAVMAAVYFSWLLGLLILIKYGIFWYWMFEVALITAIFIPSIVLSNL